MNELDHAADAVERAEVTARPLRPRPRLTLALLGVFVLWIALLVGLKLATS